MACAMFFCLCWKNSSFLKSFPLITYKIFKYCGMIGTFHHYSGTPEKVGPLEINYAESCVYDVMECGIIVRILIHTWSVFLSKKFNLDLCNSLRVFTNPQKCYF